MPDWKSNHLRVAVPIMQPDSINSVFEWRRVCNVTTLGELLVHLGDVYTARQIYFFYRSLRIVAVKRQKQPRSGYRAKKRGYPGASFWHPPSDDDGHVFCMMVPVSDSTSIRDA